MNKIQLHFKSALIDPATIQRTDDNAIILNAAPMAVGDYEYFGFESDVFQERGFKWDDKLIGRVEQAEAERILPQFEGLAVTDDHVWVDSGKRAEIAVGTCLKAGEIDGALVKTRVVIHDPITILKVTSGDAHELSIGFWNVIRWNENKQSDSDPDFFVEAIDLNHVAVVKEGRAGPDARLSNYKAKIEEHKMKITIDGIEYDVDDAVATEFTRLADQATALENSVAEVTAERDTAVGSLAAAKTQIENSKGKAKADAVAIAKDHAVFVDEAGRMGYAAADLVLGEYDADKIRREILANNGTKLADDASADIVRGAWLHAVGSLGDEDSSVLDGVKPTKIENKAGEQSQRQKTENATRNAYFGGRKAKKEA